MENISISKTVFVLRKNFKTILYAINNFYQLNGITAKNTKANLFQVGFCDKISDEELNYNCTPDDQ